MYNINGIIEHRIARFNHYICFEKNSYIHTISIFNIQINHYIIYYPEYNTFHYSENKLSIVHHGHNIKIITNDTSIKNSITIME